MGRVLADSRVGRFLWGGNGNNGIGRPVRRHKAKLPSKEDFIGEEEAEAEVEVEELEERVKELEDELLDVQVKLESAELYRTAFRECALIALGALQSDSDFKKTVDLIEGILYPTKPAVKKEETKYGQRSKDGTAKAYAMPASRLP